MVRLEFIGVNRVYTVHVNVAGIKCTSPRRKCRAVLKTVDAIVVLGIMYEIASIIRCSTVVVVRRAIMYMNAVFNTCVNDDFKQKTP